MSPTEETQSPNFYSVSEPLPSDLEPAWASKLSQSIYVYEQLLCTVELYSIDLKKIDSTPSAVDKALRRRRTTSEFGYFFEDRRDGGMDYLLSLYDHFDLNRFTTLLFIDRIKASEIFFLSPELQDSIFKELAKKNGGTGFLCCSPTEHTFVDLADSRPDVAPFTNDLSGDNPRARTMDSDLIFSRNQFAFLFEVDRSSPGPNYSPKPPVFLRPFVEGRVQWVANYPTTNMPGSKYLVGSDLPGPRGIFVSRELLT